MQRLLGRAVGARFQQRLAIALAVAATASSFAATPAFARSPQPVDGPASGNAVDPWRRRTQPDAVVRAGGGRRVGTRGQPRRATRRRPRREHERSRGPLTVAPIGSTVCPTAQYHTIQSAVTAAPAGSMIKVCAGTYVEQVTIPAGKNGLTLYSVPDLQAVIKAPPVMVGTRGDRRDRRRAECDAQALHDHRARWVQLQLDPLRGLRRRRRIGPDHRQPHHPDPRHAVQRLSERPRSLRRPRLASGLDRRPAARPSSTI